jgi:hypothetical protein
MHVGGLRPRRPSGRLRWRTHRCCLPPERQRWHPDFRAFRGSITPPARAPVNASHPASRLTTHDSGTVWLARPSPYGSFIRTSTPVYPGAPPFAPRTLLRFDATTKQCAPGRCIGTFGLVGSPLCALSLSITDPVLKFRTKAWTRVMPPLHRSPHGP